MIPYDDLVAALATWRGKNGLPVGAAPPRAWSAPPAVVAAPPAPSPPRSPPPAPGRGPLSANPSTQEVDLGEEGTMVGDVEGMSEEFDAVDAVDADDVDENAVIDEENV